MSLPSDVNADVEEAARAMDGAAKAGRGAAQRVSGTFLGRVEPQHYGFAAAVLVAFLGVAVLGPRVREMRRPRRESVTDRTWRAARQARRKSAEAADEARRRLRRLGGGTIRAR